LVNRRVILNWLYHMLLGAKIFINHNSEHKSEQEATVFFKVLCKIWGFHSSDYEECCPLGCYTAWLLWEPTFWRIIRVTRISKLGTTLAVTSKMTHAVKKRLHQEGDKNQRGWWGCYIPPKHQFLQEPHPSKRHSSSRYGLNVTYSQCGKAGWSVLWPMFEQCRSWTHGFTT
jgi:hypothetical protein